MWQTLNAAYRQRAVVVGAGPAGATAAIYLAKRGFSVDIYERRPEPQKDQARAWLSVAGHLIDDLRTRLGFTEASK